MYVKVLKEAGYEEALLGLSLSYNVEDISRVVEVAVKLCQKDGGHNKFLESMIVWVDIDAPRYWWAEFDTYRVGITKQSESTMHTLMKRELVESDCVEGTSLKVLDVVNDCIRRKDFMEAKKNLPEGFLQRRVVMFSYKVLRNIIFQRYKHRLKEWHVFMDKIYSGIMYPEFLPIFRESDFK